jgi:methylated-DNA-[protein]-cysteine S-methyltransferase
MAGTGHRTPSAFAFCNKCPPYLSMSNTGKNTRLVYKDISSPLGLIRLVATQKGLAAILWEGEGYDRTKLDPPERDDQNPILLLAEQQLKEYFERNRKVFEVPLDLSGTDFQRQVWEALLLIPFGAKKTYGALARMIGNGKAAQAVGSALNKNPVSIIVPCHRVIGSSGKLAGFAGGLKNKSILLELEGSGTPDLFHL